jgi:hypothetical protein
VRVLSLLLIAGCGSSSTAAPPPDEPVVVAAEERYHATVLPAESAHGDIEQEALDATKVIVERALAGTGGVTDGDPAPALPRYVFRPSVGEVTAEPTGRTRATVTVMVEINGRIVASLRGTATAYVERTAPLGDRQLAAIDGALQGAFQNLPELVARLEQR